MAVGIDVDAGEAREGGAVLCYFEKIKAFLFIFILENTHCASLE